MRFSRQRASLPPLAVLVPGGGGQLGHAIAASAAPHDRVHHPSSSLLDVTQPDQVAEAVADLAVTAASTGHLPVVVNAAAYTYVDAAETARCSAVAANVDGPRNLAAACDRFGVPLIHVSTDYVFRGDTTRPYDVADPTGPTTVYGMTKLAGERAVYESGAQAWIVRTSWLYGVHGHNFVKTIARLEEDREIVRVVRDQYGSPTWAADLAAGLLELSRAAVTGTGPSPTVLHCTGAGETTWYDFARAIFEELGADPERVMPCRTDEFPGAAPRPRYTVLSDASWRRAGLTPLQPWRAALAAAFAAHRSQLAPQSRRLAGEPR
ncbi:dTDP-4-dehydrorhamnose reductase [Polymorphospora rubra]|uniref:dTDP-4-dehydrorhamnose reductase n=1 Tax=Polymorphospora rubra TaxID=338584 RepID=UPI0033F9349C